MIQSHQRLSKISWIYGTHVLPVMLRSQNTCQMCEIFWCFFFLCKKKRPQIDVIQQRSCVKMTLWMQCNKQKLVSLLRRLDFGVLRKCVCVCFEAATAFNEWRKQDTDYFFFFLKRNTTIWMFKKWECIKCSPIVPLFRWMLNQEGEIDSELHWEK